MKKLLLTVLLNSIILLTVAQHRINIKGQIDNIDVSETIYLGIGSLISPLELAPDGSFTVENSVETTPSFFYLAKVSSRGKIERQIPQIWFEDENVEIQIDWSDKSYQVKDRLAFQSNSENIEARNGKDQFALILENPNQIPSLFFAEKQKEKLALEELERLAEKFTEESKSSVYGRKINSYIEAKKRAKLVKGGEVQDFTLPDRNGRQVSVLGTNNKVTLVTVFSSGCQYSLASVDLLEQFAQKSAEQIDIITIWEDPSKDAWLNAHADKKEKITWTNLWDEYGFAATYMKREIWPSFYVINADGVLVDKFTGYNQKTAEKLRKLL